MPSHPSINTNRVVVALLDGRRLKGFVFDFYPGGESLNLFPSHGDPDDKRPATVVEFASCKAVFFVRNHMGNAAASAEARKASEDPGQQAPRGRKIRVVFNDGEEMTCCTEVYSPKRFGFFVYPLDPRSNNLRIFIVNANVRSVLTGKTLDAAPNQAPEQDRVARLGAAPAPREMPKEDLKCEVALRVLGGEDPADLQREYGFSTTVLTFWTRAFLKGGKGAFSEKAEPATETLVTEFQDRIRDLEQEVERLRKVPSKALARS